MKIRLAICATLVGIVNCAFMPLATAGTWSAPTTVAVVPYDNVTGTVFPQMDIDGNGNLVAAWAPRSGYNNIPPNIALATAASFLGAWAAPINLTFTGTVSDLLSVTSNSDGFSTALLLTSAGLVSSDHTVGGGWIPGVLVSPNFKGGPTFTNRTGDHMVAALGTGVLISRGNVSTPVTATFRHGSAAWGSTETVATGNDAVIEDAAVGADGSAIVVWMTHTATCARFCKYTNYVRHVSTRAPGKSPWTEVAALPAPLNDSSNSFVDVAADAFGNQVFLVRRTSDGTGQALVRRSGVWSTPATAFPAAVTLWYRSEPRLLLDGVGNATIVVSTAGAASNNNIPGNASIGVIDGNLGANSWSPIHILSGLDVTASFTVAENSSGAAVVAYESNYNTGLPVSFHAVARASTTGTWSAPKNLDSSSASGYYFDRMVINESGQAAVMYTVDNAAVTLQTIRVLEYKP